MVRWLVVLTLGLATSGSAGAAPRPQPCPATARILAQGRLGRVVDVEHTLVVCLPGASTGRAIGLTEAADGCVPDRCFTAAVAVSGRRLAFGVDSIGRDGLGDRIVVQDIVTGHYRRDFFNGTFHQADRARCGNDGSYEGVGPTTDIVLRSDGAIAWIAQRLCAPAAEKSFEVHARIGGRTVTLDAGTGIGPTSLVLRRDGLLWTRDGTTRRATLP